MLFVCLFFLLLLFSWGAAVKILIHDQSRLHFILLIFSNTKIRKGLFKVQVPTKHNQSTVKKLRNGYFSLLKIMISLFRLLKLFIFIMRLKYVLWMFLALWTVEVADPCNKVNYQDRKNLS